MPTLEELQAKLDELKRRMNKRNRDKGDLLDKALAPLMLELRTKEGAATEADEFAAALEDLRASLSVPQKIHDQLLTQLGKDTLREIYLTAAVDYRVPMPIFPDEHAAITMNAARAGLPEVVGDAIVKRMGDSSGEGILKQIADNFFFGIALKPK